jgi:hypothetical protein
MQRGAGFANPGGLAPVHYRAKLKVRISRCLKMLIPDSHLTYRFRSASLTQSTLCVLWTPCCRIKQCALSGRSWLRPLRKKARLLSAGDCMKPINKSGSKEAHGRGLRPVIAAALIAEIPLSVSTRNLCDFLTFIDDQPPRLTPDVTAITAWCRNAIERGVHHRCQPRLTSVQA